jgi:hypothetical protein
MQIILHRRNTIEELIATSPEYGVEVDIRSYEKRLIVQHEPFSDSINFEEWIKFFRHKTLILNIKEEGIEYKVKDIVEKHGIKDFFFLDLSFPYLIKMVNSGEKRVAVRFSEYESLETVLLLCGKVCWVWVDCFTRMPLDDSSYNKLREAGFKLCLVSPELQSQPGELLPYKNNISKRGWKFDAVCTKYPEEWQ